MTTGLSVALVSLLYILALFLVAWWGDRRAAAGRPVSGPSVYALSLAVYCTTWTFYGSVGRASTDGIGFLPTYLGPTLVMTLGFAVVAKVLRIARRQRSTSIADFMASRYGRSQLLGGLVALVAIVGITPYIALQLKAVSVGFDVLTGGSGGPAPAVLADTGFWVAVMMAAFAIMFGTRSIDASEHHPGLVAAIAFESIVKLLAFMALGIAVVWGLFGGLGDLFGRAVAHPELQRLFTADAALEGGTWVTVTLLSMAAILCLPRQFQVLVVENTDESHLDRALWLFPLYLLLINLFVLPIALAGLLALPAGTDPDMIVLALPLSVGWEGLALLAFIGGLSAATGMIIVESVALATMVSNDLVLPLLLRWHSARLDRVQDLGRLLLTLRRAAIVLVLGLGYLYFRSAGSAYALVSIGLISFAAVAQFAPAMIGGIFWTGGTRRGALTGLSAGTLVWLWTLLLPSFARSGWLDASLLTEGPWGIGLLRPYALLGLEGLDPLAHSLFWSMVANIGLYVAVSVLDRQSPGEQGQATAFVEVFEHREESGAFRGRASVGTLQALLARFLGPDRAAQAMSGFLTGRTAPSDPDTLADVDLVRKTELLLAGAIGAASARVAVAAAVGDGDVGMPELLRMMDETSQVIEYSRRLEQKSAELERATDALSAANERLRELDRMKDEFLSTVTHELRTPLTSMRALSELLYDNPDMHLAERQEFLATVIKESERLTRLINQVLDMAKIEAGEIDWTIETLDLGPILRDAAAATSQLFRDRQVTLSLEFPEDLPPVRGDRDRLTQIAVNLLSNAVKFAPGGIGSVIMAVEPGLEALLVSVGDNGPGIAPEHRESIFEKFRQVSDPRGGKPQGTGLGLSICRRLVEGMGGSIWVDSHPGSGAVFSFTVPLAR